MTQTKACHSLPLCSATSDHACLLLVHSAALLFLAYFSYLVLSYISLPTHCSCVRLHKICLKHNSCNQLHLTKTANHSCTQPRFLLLAPAHAPGYNKAAYLLRLCPAALTLPSYCFCTRLHELYLCTAHYIRKTYRSHTQLHLFSMPAAPALANISYSHPLSYSAASPSPCPHTAPPLGYMNFPLVAT